jgi:hypothetical protein
MPDNEVLNGQLVEEVGGGMSFPVIVVVVLTAWGVGAAVGSASTYLVGAIVGVVATLIMLAVTGGLAAWRSSRREEIRVTLS